MRTSGLCVMAFGVLLLHGASPVRAAQRGGPTVIQAARSKTVVVPADESGGDDGDDGADGGETE